MWFPLPLARSHLEKLNLGLFFNFKSDKCPESGKEKSGKSGIRTFENSRTTGTGRDVRLSPTCRTEMQKYFCSFFGVNENVKKSFLKLTDL